MALAGSPPFQGPVIINPDSHTVDAIASSIAIMPSLGVAGVCGALALPADVYWKLQRPDDAFGAHAAEQVCIYPAAAVGRSDLSRRRLPRLCREESPLGSAALLVDPGAPVLRRQSSERNDFSGAMRIVPWVGGSGQSLVFTRFHWRTGTGTGTGLRRTGSSR